MLKHLTFTNFKALESVRIPLARLTVLVGANGVGKSTVLEGAQLLSRVSEPDLTSLEPTAYTRVRRWVEDLSWLKQRETAGLARGEWSVEARLAGPSPTLRLTGAASTGYLHIETPTGRASLGLKSENDSGHVLFSSLASEPPLRAFALRPTAEALSAPSYADTSRPVIEPNGAGIPSVLADLAATDPEALEQVMSDLRSIVPSVRRCKTPRHQIAEPLDETVTDDDGTEYTRTVTRQVWGHRLELEIEGNGFVPAAHLSEGTLRALAFLCAVATAPQNTPFVLLLDDFDVGLHPTAQEALVRVFRGILERREEVQFLCTTHSPFVLDFFDEHEVIVLARKGNGTTVARGLSEHPDWPSWKKQLKPGEFWTSVGESWVTEAP